MFASMHEPELQDLFSNQHLHLLLLPASQAPHFCSLTPQVQYLLRLLVCRSASCPYQLQRATSRFVFERSKVQFGSPPNYLPLISFRNLSYWVFLPTYTPAFGYSRLPVQLRASSCSVCVTAVMIERKRCFQRMGEIV